MMMSAQIVTSLSGFILLLFMPRYLGNAGYGRLYLAMSIQIIFQYLIDYGGQYQITKEISRDPERTSEIMTHAAFLRVGLWIASIFMTLLLCRVANYPFSTSLLVMILAASNLWTSLTSQLRYCYQGFEEMKYPSLGAVVERSFLMLTVVPALIFGAREVVLVVLMAISTLLSFGISLRYAGRMFKFNLSVRLKNLKPLIVDGVPYFLWAVFGIIYYRIDAVMLSVMAPDSAVGWYGAAYRFFDILMFIPSIFAQALYPILSRLSKSEMGSMKNTSQKSLEFLLLAGIPISTGLIFFAGPIIQVLFGLSEFGPSVPILQIFSVGTLIVYIDFVLGNTVLALDRQKAWATVAFAAIFVNVGFNYFLIRYFQTQFGNGGIGAAIATDFTELFVMVCAIWMLPKAIFTGKFFVITLKGVASGAAMSAAIVGSGLLHFPWVVQAVIGTAVYVMSLLLLATFEKNEIDIILKAFSPNTIRGYIFSRRGVQP